MTKKTYLHERVYDQMGVTPEQNKIQVFVENELGDERSCEMPIFSSDPHDNIDILVYTLDRRLIYYDHKDATPEKPNIYNQRTQHFKLTRFKEPKGDKKYNIPKGVGTHPFLPPSLIEKFEKGEKIDTLYLTEGYFKSFKASMHEFDIVGLSSITHYAESKTKLIHQDIARIIIKCEVKRVVMLYDGDCLNISLEALNKSEDIAKRPVSFLSSMLKIRELLISYDVKIFFSHILSERITNNPKGLDDLLIEMKGQEQSIYNDAINVNKPSPYFYRLNVSNEPKKLQEYFNLKSVNQFFGFWQEAIKETEFEYYGTKYKWNENDQKLIKTIPREAKDYIRVGDDYWELVEVPTLFDDISETKLMKRSKTTITDDLGKKIIESIPKYKAFTNIPSHTNYQRIIKNCYNKYSPMVHEPEQGNWNNIKEFLEHIFGEHYEYGLDYIQNLYQYPTQILPILCLVSKENQTGKTTFLNFLKLIFGENACIVGNAELSNEFNAYTATRLIVGVDETFLEKKTTIEKIKMLSTSNRIAMQRKGVDHEEMWHFAKYILLSNNEDTFIYANDEDIRYWVRKVHTIKKVVPDLLDILYYEIPAFLYFLNDRKFFATKTGRAFFDPKLLETDALKNLRLASKPTVQKEIESFVRSMFLDFGRKYQILNMPLDYIKEKTYGKKYEDNYVRRILNDNMHVHTSQKVERSKVPEWGCGANDDDVVINYVSLPPKRNYIFRIESFLTTKEIEGLSIEKPQIKKDIHEVKPKSNIVEQLQLNDDDIPF